MNPDSQQPAGNAGSEPFIVPAGQHIDSSGREQTGATVASTAASSAARAAQTQADAVRTQQDAGSRDKDAQAPQDKGDPDQGRLRQRDQQRSQALQAPEPEDPRKVKSPVKLTGKDWAASFKNAFKGFQSDQGTDMAAALTYYTVLSIFPALLALVSVVRLFGQSGRFQEILNELIAKSVPDSGLASTLTQIIDGFFASKGAGVALILGLVLAIWSASGYVGAFSRMMNRVYGMLEGRPPVKLKAEQLGLTVVVIVGVLAMLTTLTLKPLVNWIGGYFGGAGETFANVWGFLAWPVALLILILLVAILFYAAPNVKQPKFRWVSIGSIVAVLIAMIAAFGFGFYVSHFGNYQKTYGALAGVIIFLFLLWLVNLSLILGVELDAEVERTRQRISGMPADEQPVLPPRDTKTWQPKKSKKSKKDEEDKEKDEKDKDQDGKE